MEKGFQPTRPLRGATHPMLPEHYIEWISTHAPLAGRDDIYHMVTLFAAISTHAPLAGRDRMIDRQIRSLIISTHAPLAGRDRK